ncbi:MAG: hypothetical protein ABJF10_00895 [Chthoniobacter sp.]|uniref:hypothetical protein n=1 Tax=Chthoniobacter sp. TaxID=2510640 RepID=UPI0032A3A101
MKKVLSLLVAFVFLQVQSWALSGGPVYAGTTAAVKGTYAGSLVPAIAGNSLGIFSIGVPSTGLASGVFAMFISGGAFYGSIVGIIDPDKLTLNALAQAQENAVRTLFANGQLQILTIPVALASGSIQAKLIPTKQQFASQSGGGYRLTGSGELQTSSFPAGGGAPVPGVTVAITVDGFQQSTTVDSTINLSTLTGTQSSTTGG